MWLALLSLEQCSNNVWGMGNENSSKAKAAKAAFFSTSVNHIRALLHAFILLFPQLPTLISLLNKLKSSSSPSTFTYHVSVFLLKQPNFIVVYEDNGFGIEQSVTGSRSSR